MAFVGLSPESRLALVRAKVERAEQNLVDMETSLNQFYGYPPRPKRKIESFKRTEGRIHTYQVPFDTLCAAGDVIGNLVGALDHLAFQLVWAYSPDTPEAEFRHIYFPLADDEARCKARLKAIKKLIYPDAVELIKSIKPYAGGNEALGLLYKLNNLSKHRLILNVAEIVVCYTASGRKEDSFLYKPGDVYFFGIWGRPQSDDYILPAGIETISEIRAGQPEALLPTLHYLIAVVDGLIKNFLPYL